MLSDGNDIGASDFGDGNTAIGLIGSIEINVVRANTSGDGDLQLLRLCKALCGEVTWVEPSTLLVRVGCDPDEQSDQN